jgi:hypothetical protein
LTGAQIWDAAANPVKGNMDSYLLWTLALCVLGLAVTGGAWALRTFIGGASPAAGLFKPKGTRRLAVVEYMNIDAKRRLILVRCDETEHLLLTGGPSDLVVQSRINPDAKEPRHQG